MSLDSLRAGNPVELVFWVPDSTQWKRIRQQRTMGDNGYIVLAASERGGKVIPFSTMDLAVSVSGAAGPIDLKKEDHTPYGYSSDTYDVGLRFHPLPRDEVRVRVTARGPDRLPNGELIIEPYWNWSAKDFGVGASIDADLKPYVIRITQLGLVILAAGVAGVLVEQVRGSKSPRL